MTTKECRNHVNTDFHAGVCLCPGNEVITPTIPEIWRIMQFPGEPGRVSRSTVNNRDELCVMVSPDGLRWEDPQTGGCEGRVEFIERVLDVSAAEARWRLDEVRRDIAAETNETDRQAGGDCETGGGAGHKLACQSTDVHRIVGIFATK